MFDPEVSKLLCRMLQVDLLEDKPLHVAGHVFTLGNRRVYCDGDFIGEYGAILPLDEQVLQELADKVLPVKNVHLCVQRMYLYAALTGESEIKESCSVFVYRCPIVRMGLLCVKTPYGSTFEGYYDEERNQIYYLMRTTEYAWDDLSEAIRRSHRDSKFTEFYDKMLVFPAYLPCKGTHDSVFRWDNDARLVVKDQLGYGCEEYDWSVSEMIYLLCLLKDTYLEWLEGTQVVGKASDTYDRMAEQILTSCKERAPLTATYIDGNMFEAVALRNMSTLRVFAWFRTSKHIVTYNMNEESIESLAKFLQIPSDSVAVMFDQYVKRNGIENPTTELLRLLKLAGVSDVEDRLGTVLDSITR